MVSKNLLQTFPTEVIYFISVFILCLEIYFFYLIKNRREPAREVFFKILGSHFFVLYIAYRLFMRLKDFQWHPGLSTIFSWMNWSLIMLTFFLFFFSYLIRKPPISKAHTFRERFYPLLCTSLSYLVYESSTWLFWDKVRNIPFFKFILTPFYPPLRPSFISMALLLAGNTVILVGIFYLRSCFSMMTQARGHVRNGIYRFIRHPLYLGQTLTTVGFCFWVPSWFNIGVTILFIFLQRLRAYFEEVKLESVFPDYKEYKAQTGAYFPRLRIKNTPSRSGKSVFSKSERSLID